MAFPPNGATLALVIGHKGVWRLRLPEFEKLGEPWEGSTGGNPSLAFNADGTRLAAGGNDGQVRVWEWPSGRPVGKPWRAAGNPVLGVAFAPDGNALATAGWDRTAGLW